MTRFTRAVASAVAVLLIGGALTVAAAAPANAEAATQVTIQALTPATVLSGTTSAYVITVACSAVTDPDCTNAVITIPLDPANVGWGYQVPSNPRVASSSVVGNDYVINLVPSIPAGSSSVWLL